MNHTVDSILEATSEFFNVPLSDILAPKQDFHIVHARYVAIFLLRTRLHLYLKEVVDVFVDIYSDHSAISRACTKIKDELSLPVVFATGEEIISISALSRQKAKGLVAA